MKYSNLFVFAVLLLQSLSGSATEQDQYKNWLNSVQHYKKIYSLTDVNSKKVDNLGNGDDSLYGVRNFRVVLHGVYYRGGANNTYNKKLKRDNHNPLQKEALENLCQQNFGTALYFYKTNADSMQKNTTCEKNNLEYRQISALEEKNQIDILKIIHSHIVKLDTKPIYGHCWNGWHASGLIASLALMQFCKISNAQALDYWIKNTDGNNKGYDKIKKRIREFKALKDLEIEDKLRKEICPSL